MDRIIVLEKTREKHFGENEIIIKELNLEILCIFVPFKHKLKRKDREKLINLVSGYDEVFSNESDLSEFETKFRTMNWIGYFLSETLNYITKEKGTKKISVESLEFSDTSKKIILELGERYRIVELYTRDIIKAEEFAENIYDTVGLPIKIINSDMVKSCQSDYIVKINSGVSIYNCGSDTTYTDVELSLLYPLNKYGDLPVYKIIKSGLEHGRYKDIIQKGMVKIVGEISK